MWIRIVVLAKLSRSSFDALGIRYNVLAEVIEEKVCRRRTHESGCSAGALQTFVVPWLVDVCNFTYNR